jgi:ABC-type Fe3+ transport system substrate-binding protein
MLLVTKGLPEGDVKRFVEFMLSSEGQAVVEKFFVRVKK